MTQHRWPEAVPLRSAKEHSLEGRGDSFVLLRSHLVPLRAPTSLQSPLFLSLSFSLSFFLFSTSARLGDFWSNKYSLAFSVTPRRAWDQPFSVCIPRRRRVSRKFPSTSYKAKGSSKASRSSHLRRRSKAALALVQDLRLRSLLNYQAIHSADSTRAIRTYNRDNVQRERAKN